MRQRLIGRVVQFLVGADVVDESIVYGSRIQRYENSTWYEVAVNAEGDTWWIPVHTIQPANTELPSCIRWAA